MGESMKKQELPSIFIIGAQCTGKTTLVDAISTHFAANYPSIPIVPIKELARGILASINVNRDDIRAGSAKAMDFQKLVLDAQWSEQQLHQQKAIIVSDRSGIDPIAYATMYGPPDVAVEMLSSQKWQFLREEMKKGVVIVCEPVQKWLFDDGIRLMPTDAAEWVQLHRTFIKLLVETEIAFKELPANIDKIEDRVEFVIDAYHQKSTNCSPQRL